MQIVIDGHFSTRKLLARSVPGLMLLAPERYGFVPVLAMVRGHASCSQGLAAVRDRLAGAMVRDRLGVAGEAVRGHASCKDLARMTEHSPAR